ncbi:MAG: 5-oxoprolinase, partial [Phycisphaerae bacterium]|nr:5-oxoprolinase [Phycisphaerae bacterium]
MSVPSRWSIAIDRGGTFTDVVAWNATEVRQTKVLSAKCVSGEDAAVVGIRKVLELDDDVPLGNDLLEVVRVGTTVATNALLTRTGERVVLVVTEGFRDLPVIGDQSRPDLFAFDIQRPQPVATQFVEARARMAVDGQVVQPLDVASVHSDLTAAFEQGYRSVAITLLHGWQHAEHEEQIAEVARA